MAVWLTTYIQVYVYKMLVLTIFLKYLRTYVVVMNGINARSVSFWSRKLEGMYIYYNTIHANTTVPQRLSNRGE